MNKTICSTIAAFSCILIISTVFFTGCVDKENNPSIPDFFKVKFNDKERFYEFKDSVIQICEVSRYDKNRFDFYGLKQFESEDVDFPSITFNIVKDSASTCLASQFHSGSYFYVKFSKLTKDNFFIDYESLERNIKKDFKINQKLVGEKIVLTGTFSGWIYQLYPRRPEGEITEPYRLDSLFIQETSFQYTSK